MDETAPSCCFCNKNHKQVRLIMGPMGNAICQECVTLCNDILGDPQSQIVFQSPDTGSIHEPTAPWDAVVATGSLRFIVIEDSWGGLPESLLLQTAFDGGTKNLPGGSPSVAAENSRGDKHVIAVAQTIEDARDLATSIEEDFNALDPTEWCERYDVPTSFVTTHP
jgi:hypothetical protein